MKEEILNAKRELLVLLNKIANTDLITDNELNIALLLTNDEQIQELFNKN